MSFSAPTPDIAGLADAQRRLRTLIGRDVRFYAPADVLYDPSIPQTAFDDEGIPLDPLASGAVLDPANVDVADLAVVGHALVNVVFQPLAAMRRDMVAEDRLGWRSRLNKDLILDISDFALAQSASHYAVGTLERDEDGNVVEPEVWTPDDGELWKVVNVKTDGFGGRQRVIVFGQGTR